MNRRRRFSDSCQPTAPPLFSGMDSMFQQFVTCSFTRLRGGRYRFPLPEPSIEVYHSLRRAKPTVDAGNSGRSAEH
jgi:hypothetical protein